MTHKSWVFTINNYTEEDIEWLKSLEVSALTVGKEIGDNETPHLQGFITWKRAYKLTGLKKLHKKAHWEPAKAIDAANYCRKGEVIIDIKNTRQGHRGDLEGAYKAAEQGVPLKEYLKCYPGHQAIKVFEIAKKNWQPERDFKPEVTWLWGRTGTGKTRKVWEKERGNLWISGKSLKWWDGYDNQEAVLFDDFRKDFCTFHELLRILDRYPYEVEIKGGTRTFNSKRIYITSCYHPERVYDTREDIGQLLRRIDKIEEVENVTVTVTEVE